MTTFICFITHISNVHKISGGTRGCMRVQSWAELHSARSQVMHLKNNFVLLSQSDGLWLSCVRTHYLYLL